MKNLIYHLVILFLIGCNSHSSIKVYSDYGEGLSNASKFNQNILLVFDFLGNPNNSAKEIIYDKEFEGILQEVTVILLNVDEPSSVGKSNRDFQKSRFGTDTQPMYYLLNSKGEMIKDPIGYCKKSEFRNFIR